MLTVPIKRSDSALDLPLPEYATDQSAGLDLLAAVDRDAGVDLPPGERALVPTGISIELPEGYEGQVRPRSGLALRHGITVLNAPGTVDSDYRGEIGVILINLGHDAFLIERGMRIAQLVIARYVQIAWNDGKTSLAGSARGDGGFGSTGLST